MDLDRDALLAYLRRGWAEARAAKERHWAERARRLGPADGLRASEDLWLHARRVDPGWPSDASRAADLADHEAWVRWMEVARDAFADR